METTSSSPFIKKHFSTAFENYKNSYRPSSLTASAIILRGIRDSKIAGGSQATSHEYPFLVSIQTYSREHYCGGSIIAAKFVLSAAHCFVSGTSVDNPTDVYVLPGTNDRTCTSCTRYRGKTITVHPNYDEQTTRNDIAILELQSSIPIDGTLTKLANVEGGSYPIDGSKTLTVSGWGYTTGTTLPTMLMKTDVVVNPLSVCLLLDMITPNQICAGGNGHDSCAGDSGGPLFRLDSSNNFVVLGIVSYGDDGCGVAQTYNNKGVYTNTTHYLSFITSVVPSVGIKTYSVLPSSPTVNNTNNNTITNSTIGNSTIGVYNSTISVSNSTIGVSNSTWNNSTSNSTVTTNCTTNCNSTIPIPNLSNSTVNGSQWYNITTTNNSTKNSSTTVTHPNGFNAVTPHFHYFVSTLIMLVISTCFNSFATANP